MSWVIPDEPSSSTVFYWAENDDRKNSAQGIVLTYKFFNYTSGYIHHCINSDLEILISLYGAICAGDLGQTQDSNRTLTHYELNAAKGQTVLFVGDLSYSDDYPFHDNTGWDTWGRFIERNSAYQHWSWTAGNQELDFAPSLGEGEPFKPYRNRFHVPYKTSQSTSPLWYSIKRASAYIIVFSSYSALGKPTPQYKWFRRELPLVNRTETPWLIILMHCTLYTSYANHYMEGEPM